VPNDDRKCLLYADFIVVSKLYLINPVTSVLPFYFFNNYMQCLSPVRFNVYILDVLYLFYLFSFRTYAWLKRICC